MAAHRAGSPGWLLGLLAVGVVLIVVNFVALYWYFALRAPDALRPEKYTLAKIAITQESLRGDDLIGFVRAISEDRGERTMSEPKPPDSLPSPEGKSSGSRVAKRSGPGGRSKKPGESGEHPVP